jgi:hypothetical protein
MRWEKKPMPSWETRLAAFIFFPSLSGSLTVTITMVAKGWD